MPSKKKKEIVIDGVRYRTVNQCLAEFFNCSPKELSKVEGRFDWIDTEGDYHSQPVQDAMADIRKRNFWAWVENKKTIHYFVRKKATFREVLTGFAHEIGHMRRPFHRTLVEEQKAGCYAAVAAAAHDITVQIKGKQ